LKQNKLNRNKPKKEPINQEQKPTQYSQMNAIEIEIDEKIFHYKISPRRYIVTFIDDYPVELVEQLFKKIDPMYHTTFKLVYSNLCGPNSKYLCEYFREKNLASQTTMIIISDSDWKYNNKTSSKTFEKNMKIINNLFGSSILLINIGYHALPYFTIINPDTPTTEYHIAIETNISYPYKLQFYVGKTLEELSYMLNARYLCVSFKMIHDLENWRQILY
jgi:hypothetical protein